MALTGERQNLCGHRDLRHRQILSLPVNQRVRLCLGDNRPHATDHDAMRVTLQNFFNFAIDARERAFENRRAGFKRVPLRISKSGQPP